MQSNNSVIVAKAAIHRNDSAIDSGLHRSDEYTEGEKYSVLDRVNTPADIKTLTDSEIKQLANDVRQHVIKSVAKTGGHLGAGLGVVELTTAIHAVFDTQRDKLIWDVGHQCYPHKINGNTRKKK